MGERDRERGNEKERKGTSESRTTCRSIYLYKERIITFCDRSSFATSAGRDGVVLGFTSPRQCISRVRCVLYVHDNVLCSWGLQLCMFSFLFLFFCFFVSGLKMVMKVLMDPRENNVFYGEETGLNFL